MCKKQICFDRNSTALEFPMGNYFASSCISFPRSPHLDDDYNKLSARDRIDTVQCSRHCTLRPLRCTSISIALRLHQTAGRRRWRRSSTMGLVSGMVAGLLLGVALMAAWSRMMRRRSTKRVAKVPTAARLVVCLFVGNLLYLGSTSIHSFDFMPKPTNTHASKRFSLGT